MIATLARATLVRHRSRTLLAILGVAVSAAMLLDMVMLASGMRVSFRSLLLSRGFQIRLAPRGTLPFDTDASINGETATVRRLRADPDITTVSPTLGGQLHVTRGALTVSSIALGVEPDVEGDYEITAGRDIAAPYEAVATTEFLAAARLQIGDTIAAAAGFDPVLRAFTGRRSLRIVGRAHFLYMPALTRVVALPLATLQQMQGPRSTDHVSVVMIRARAGVNVESLRQRIERELPDVSAISTATALKQVDERLSYFRQLAFILGAISLVVGFLLVTTLVTVSVNERVGEIAVLRAIGLLRSRVVLQILLEGVAIMLTGAVLGLGLGLVTAHFLNAILADFPGLPAAIDFFLFQPRDAWTALGLITVAGVLAGAYPAWRGSSLPIATTLREEGIA